MIDMHSHILFGVDDGPKTIEDSMHLIEKAVDEGITDLIATPHAFSPKYHVPKDEIDGQLRLLKNVVQKANYPVKLHAGQEVRLHDHLIEKVNNGEVVTLARSRYLLLEFPSQSVPAYTMNIIQELLIEGTIPIIAHPEKNRAISQKPELLEKMVRCGAFAQITAGSICGHFGRDIQKTAFQLIEANLIHVYGSDVHDLRKRPFLYNKGLDILEKKKYIDIAEILLINNERIVKNDPFIILEPKNPVVKKWWKITV